MPDELTTRVDRLEQAMISAFDGIKKLDDVLATLTDSQIQLQQSQIKLHQEMSDLGRTTDERIQALVRAIAELVRRDNGKI